MKKHAALSDCRKYRYSLWRQWDKSKPYCLFIGLNPSTANETEDDPTIRRCIDFAKRWGYGGLCVANLFAYRTKDPKEMKKKVYPVGFENDKFLLKLSRNAGVVVAAWGVNGNHLSRDRRVRTTIPGMMCLGKTNGGHPKHPLYLKKDTTLIPFN